jgi:hypothetical protein
MESNGSRSLSPLNHNGVVSSFLIDTNTTLFDENFQKIDNPLKQFSEESSLISKKLLDLQRDITSRRCVIDKNEMEKLFEHCETLERELSAHNTLIQQIKPHLAEVWNAQLDSIRKQQLLVQNRLNELSTLHRFIQQVLATGHKLKPLSNFLTSVISAVDNRRSGLVGPSPMEQICMEILTILPNSDQRVNAIEKEEEQRRQAREAEKIVAEKEARALKKNLKETRRNRQRPISMIVVEQSRDRDDAAAISPGLSLKRQPRV